MVIVVDTDILSMFAKILKALWKKKLKSKGEVKQILERIKTADNLAMSKEIERGIFVD
jgi:hypothetical protein